MTKIQIMKRLGLQNPRHFAWKQQRENMARISSESDGFKHNFYEGEIFRRTGRDTIDAVSIIEHLLKGKSVHVVNGGGCATSLMIWKNLQKTVSELMRGLYNARVEADEPHPPESKVVYSYRRDTDGVGVTADVVYVTTNLFANVPQWVWEVTDDMWDKADLTSVNITEVSRAANWTAKTAAFSIRFEGITRDSFAVEEAEFLKYVESRRKVLGCEKYKGEG